MKRTVYLLIATLILASCGGEKEDAQAKLTKLKKERVELDEKIAKLEAEVRKDNPEKPTAVSVKTLQPEQFSSYVEVQAQVSGDENVTAMPQAPGQVKSVNVKVGQNVRKGQVLAVLDAASVEQRIKGQEAQLVLLKQLYQKQQKLWDQQVGTEVQLLSAKANYESAQKQYQALVAERKMYQIVAPISGTVDAVNIKVGDMAGGVSPYGIRIVSFDKLKVVAQLGENYIGKVNKGDAVKLIFSEIGDSINKSLTYVSRSVDPVSRAFTAEVWLGNVPTLTPNMSCRMQITNYKNDDALIVPVSVIQNTVDGDMLYIADGKKAKMVQVTTGRNSNGNVEILSGLSAGDQVIVEGYAEVEKGDSLEIQK